MALREAAAERALFGVIVRVDGEAPSQGYYGAQLRPLAGSTADTLNFELVAVPPAGAEAVGSARSRELSAAVFVPNLMLKKLRTVRVSGGGAVRTLSLPPAPAQ